jgi:two-component system, chemotaxis family, sensor kinase CheA
MRQVDRLIADVPGEPSSGDGTSDGAGDGAGDAGDAPQLPSGSETAAHQDGLQTSIKVDTRKLDNLVDMIGELIVVQSLIQEDPSLVHLIDGQLARNLGQLKRITTELHRDSMALRMVPIRQAFQKVARVVRDLSRKAGKPVDLVLSGEETELDRKMVEEITDPLMHMARNSLDHGVERPDDRRLAGKPERSTLTLSAAHQGGQIVIQIADDGAGLATDKILAKARARGLIGPDVTPAPEDVHRLIFEPGFSTAEAVTEVSGRGVGMDVVRRNIESLRGRIAIATEAGKGTVFTITIPLTLAVLDGLLVRVGGERLVLPASAVRESLRPRADQVHAVCGVPRMIRVRESVLPLLALGELVGIPGAATDPLAATVVVMDVSGSRVGLIVDELINKQEVVVKSLGETFGGVRGLAGGAILGDGRIGLIVDPHGIIELIGGGRLAA